MAKCIIFKGNTYTKEEYNNIPVTEKIEAILSSPNLQQYLDLGYSQLSRDGVVYAVTPVGQEEYKQALRDFSDVKAHADTIISKIREIFTQHEDSEKVEAALVLLDTLAQTWSQRTGRPKEYYYQRYTDVRQSTPSDLIGRPNTLSQVIGRIGTDSMDAFYGDDMMRTSFVFAEEMEREYSVTENDWKNRNYKLEQKRIIKSVTGWERNTSGKWIYEIPDGDLKSLDLLSTETFTELTDIYDDVSIYRAYPEIQNVTVTLYEGNEDNRAYVVDRKIFINKKLISNAEEFKKSLLHEIYHIISDIEGFERGGNPDRIEKSLRNVLEQIRVGNDESTLSESDRRFKQFYEKEFGATPLSFEQIQEDLIPRVALAVYNQLEGEVAARNVANRTTLDEETRKYTLLSDTFDVGPEDTIYPNVMTPPSNISFQIIGEQGVLNLSDAVNRLQNLQLAKQMLSQSAPMGVIKRITGWEQEDNIWKTETDDLWNFSVKRMPKEGVQTTIGELVGDVEVLTAYPQLSEIQVEFGNYSDYFSAAYQPDENKIVVNKQHVTNLQQLKSSLVHELQHAVQEIEGWQQGTNPEDAGSRENYLNSVGETEARNASTRMDLTNEDKLESLLQDTADVAPEDRVYVERVNSLVAQQSVSENMTPIQQITGDVLAPKITYPTDFGDAEYVREPDGDVRLVLPQTNDSVYRAAVEFNSENQAVLHALNAPNVSSLVHEFAHMFEQDLDDTDIETLEKWSKFERGTTEFREVIAEGFEKFITEDHPELSELNQIFSKIAKWISNLYKSLTTSPLNLELSDDVRMVYAKVVGVEQAFSMRINRMQNAVSELSNEERLNMIKKARGLKQYLPSSLPFDTKVVKKNGSIGIVGREDLSGTNTREKRDGIGDTISYHLLSDLANIYEKANTLTIPGKKSIVPSC